MNKTAMRLCGGMVLGALLGLLSFYGFTQHTGLRPELQALTEWSFSNFMMWGMVAQKALLGFVVGLAGYMTVHPLFGFRLPYVLRGFAMGIFVALPSALDLFIDGVWSEQLMAFGFMIVFSGVVGLFIDTILTKLVGEGNDLKS